MTAVVPRLRKTLVGKAPDLAVEREFWAAGRSVVVGMDEVGKGAWAGPISVGAAVVPRDRRVYKIRDSKMLTQDEREALFKRIADWCDAWAVGHASPQECDRLGMSEAQRLAAKRALVQLAVKPDAVLIDGNWDFVGLPGTRKIVKGDATCLSIAAASVLAKVTRDRIMRRLADRFPGYNFENNKGYRCPHQQAGLEELGPCAVHRHSWAFMESVPGITVPRYRRPQPQGTLFD